MCHSFEVQWESENGTLLGIGSFSETLSWNDIVLISVQLGVPMSIFFLLGWPPQFPFKMEIKESSPYQKNEKQSV